MPIPALKEQDNDMLKSKDDAVCFDGGFLPSNLSEIGCQENKRF
jgi:hypothetical protein